MGEMMTSMCSEKKKSDKLEFKIQQGITKSPNGIILINRYIEFLQVK